MSRYLIHYELFIYFSAAFEILFSANIENVVFSRDFIKEYSATHPESSGLKAVRIYVYIFTIRCIIVYLSVTHEHVNVRALFFRPQRQPQMHGS